MTNKFMNMITKNISKRQLSKNAVSFNRIYIIAASTTKNSLHHSLVFTGEIQKNLL